MITPGEAPSSPGNHCVITAGVWVVDLPLADIPGVIMQPFPPGVGSIAMITAGLAGSGVSPWGWLVRGSLGLG